MVNVTKVRDDPEKTPLIGAKSVYGVENQNQTNWDVQSGYGGGYFQLPGTRPGALSTQPEAARWIDSGH